ncbi:MAG: amino acid ABC transporter substrate-binding protein [Spirochaetes bacterium]|nr:amino acid ABC transporter substrate-binding protein [Spirochaetota bacterium]
MQNYMLNIKTIPKIILTFFLLITAASIFMSCGKKGSQEIIIGTHLPLTGSGAGSGKEQKWAYEQAVADINKAGGIFVKEFDQKLPVRLIVLDDETNALKAAAAVDTLIKKELVHAILSGQVGDQGVLPGMITAEKLITYYHGTVIWKHLFLQNNFKWCTMYFEEIPDLGVLPFDIFESLPSSDRPQKIGLYLEDNIDAKAMGDGLEQVAKMKKFKIVLRTTMPISSKNYSEQINEGKKAGVDAIISFATSPDTTTLVRQMKENNFSVKAFQGFKGSWPQAFWDDLDKDAEGILHDGMWSEDYPYEGAKELGDRFYNEFSYRSVSAGMFYALCQTLWQAIEKAGTLNGAKIRQAVLDNKFQTVNGPVDYDEKGVASFPPAGFQWKQGNRVLVYPFNLTDNKIEPIVPWNKR